MSDDTEVPENKTKIDATFKSITQDIFLFPQIEQICKFILNTQYFLPTKYTFHTAVMSYYDVNLKMRR